MKRIFSLLILLSILSPMFGQKVWEEMHELYPRDLVLKNGIQKVIFNFEDGESQSFLFNKEGFLILETESLNWHSKDTSEKFYTYKNEKLAKVIHLNKSNGDTLSYNQYVYEAGRLKETHKAILSNIEFTDFKYDNNGMLVSSESIMTSKYSNDTLQMEERTYDQEERKTTLRRIVRDKEDVYRWEYKGEYVLMKGRHEIYMTGEFEQRIEFNQNQLITKFIKKARAPNGERLVSTTEMKYDKNHLFTEMTIDGSPIINVEYITK